MMANYIEELNRREVKITRFATFLLKNYSYPNLVAAQKAARAILLDAEAITSITKLNKVVAEIKAAVKDPFATTVDNLIAEMEGFAIDESEFAADAINNASNDTITPPPPSKVAYEVANGLMTLEASSGAVSATFPDFAKANANGSINMIINQVNAGYSNNETVRQIVARIRNVIGGILKNHADSLVRTGLAFYSQKAREATRDENLDVITREYPIITFDNRTSFICMSISDKYPNGWKVGQSPIGYPPYHYRCRTIIGFETEDMLPIEGTKAAVGGKNTKKADEAAEKGTLNYRKRKGADYFDPGQIPANTRFTKWLKTQPRWFIEQQLGKQLAADFINGDIRLADLTDDKLKPLSRKQIKEG